MFAAFFAYRSFGLDPYLAVFLLAPAFFVFGYALQRFIIGPASHGDDRNMLLVTLGLAGDHRERAAVSPSAPTPEPLICPMLSRAIDLGFTFLADAALDRLLA